MGKTFFVREKSFYRSMVRLALPAAFQSLLTLLVLLVDNVMVSHYSQESLAAVSQANSVSTFVTAALTGMGSGAVVLISQYWGKKNKEAVKRVCAVVFSVCTVLALLLISAILVDIIFGAFVQLLLV